MAKINKKKFVKALPGTGGIKSMIAKKLGVSRSAITQYVNKNPELKILLDQERNKIIDLAESKLFKAVESGEKWAILQVLESLGKKRGYGKNAEPIQEEEKNNKIEIEVINVLKKEDELEEFKN